MLWRIGVVMYDVQFPWEQSLEASTTMWYFEIECDDGCIKVKCESDSDNNHTAYYSGVCSLAWGSGCERFCAQRLYCQRQHLRGYVLL